MSRNLRVNSQIGNRQVKGSLSMDADKLVKEAMQVSPELKKFIRPLSESERSALEQSLLTDGCLDPIKIWTSPENEIFIVDGHNRYEICTKHDIDFNIKNLKGLYSLDDVKEYMIRTQISRRNFSKQEVSYYRGVRYNSVSIGKGGDNERVGVRDELAKSYGISTKTLNRDSNVASVLSNIPDDERAKYLIGDAVFNQSHLLDVYKILKDEISLMSETDIFDAILVRCGVKTTRVKESAGTKQVNHLESYKVKISNMTKACKSKLNDEERHNLIEHLRLMIEELS